MTNEVILQSNLGKKALNKTLCLLGKRSYTKKQIEQKLQQRGYSDEIIDAVTEYCLQMGYLNDREYVRQWVSTRNRLKPVGKRRIIHELKAKGIEHEIIISYLDDNFSNELEYELASSLIKKKIGHNLDKDHKSSEKLYRFLLRRGFSHDIIIKALRCFGIMI
jgi:regulatory protein